MHDFTGATAAAQEVSRRARSSGEVREVLIREGAVSALFKLLQQPLQMDVVGAGQPHAAAAWALFDLVGRSKAAPQGDPLAQAAMASSGAVGALTAVLKAVWRYGGSMMSQTAASQQGVDPLLGGTSGSGSLLLRSTSTASNFSLSSVSSGPQQEVAAGVQEATAAALSVLATTPAGVCLCVLGDLWVAVALIWLGYCLQQAGVRFALPRWLCVATLACGVLALHSASCPDPPVFTRTTPLSPPSTKTQARRPFELQGPYLVSFACWAPASPRL